MLFRSENVSRTLHGIRDNGKRAGLAVKPGTPISAIEPFLAQLDMVLVMTVEPGFGGQKFMHEMMSKVETARQWLTKENLNDVWLQLDGGISLDTIDIGARAGADTFVAGSAVYKSEDPAEMVTRLRNCAETALR